MSSDEYGYNDISIIFGGRVLNTLQGIKVESGWEHDGHRTKGGKFGGINETNFDVSGSFKILQSDLIAMENSYGDKLQKTYFDIIWNFAASASSTSIKTNRIKRLKLGKIPEEFNQGDAFMEIEIPFIACDYKKNI